MTTLYVATRNAKKLVEIEAVMESLDVDLRPLPDEAPEVVEDGTTFTDNAVKKAESARDFTGAWALADDSGIEVDALGGAPGVHSARWGGGEGLAADPANNALLLKKLQDTPPAERTARYRCVIALARPGQPTLTFDGKVEGLILREEHGDGGFGYDPLFYYPPFGKTFAQVPLEKKNTVSHRATALQALRDKLEELLNTPQSR